MTNLALLLGKTGLFLFVAGLVVGALVSKFKNSRMGLSAHLAGVQTGTFLLAVGAFWTAMGVPAEWQTYLVWGLILSCYVLFAGLVLSAATGAGKVMPIAGAGYEGSSSQELLVSFLVLSSSVLMLLVSLAILACFLIA